MALSEKTYELNYTGEMLAWFAKSTGGPVSAYGPSPREEATLGWDTRIENANGIEFYIQYKAPKIDTVTGDWCFEINRSRRRNQHGLLHRLAQRRPTRYCLPLFDSYNLYLAYGWTQRLFGAAYVFFLDPTVIPISPQTKAVHTIYISRSQPRQLSVHSTPKSFEADGSWDTFAKEIKRQITKTSTEREEDDAKARRVARLLRASRSAKDDGILPPVLHPPGEEGDGDGEGSSGLVGFASHRKAKTLLT